MDTEWKSEIGSLNTQLGQAYDGEATNKSEPQHDRKVALRELEVSLREEITNRHGKLDSAHRAALQASEAKLTDQVARLSGEHRKGQSALRDLISEQKEDLTTGQERRHSAHRQALQALEERLSEEISSRHTKLDAAQKALFGTLEGKFEDELLKISAEQRRLQAGVKEMMSEFREDRDAANTRKENEQRQRITDVEAHLSEEMTSRQKKTEAVLRTFIQSAESGLRDDITRIQAELQKSLQAAKNAVSEVRTDVDLMQTRLGAGNRSLTESLEAKIEDIGLRASKAEVAQRGSLQALSTEMREEITKGARAVVLAEKKTLSEELQSAWRAEAEALKGRIDGGQAAVRRVEEALTEALSLSSTEVASVRDAVARLKAEGAQAGDAGLVDEAVVSQRLAALEDRTRKEMACVSALVARVAVDGLVLQEDDDGGERSFSSLQEYLEELAKRVYRTRTGLEHERGTRERLCSRLEARLQEAETRESPKAETTQELYQREKATLQEQLKLKEANRAPPVTRANPPPSPFGSMRLLPQPAQSGQSLPVTSCQVARTTSAQMASPYGSLTVAAMPLSMRGRQGLPGGGSVRSLTPGRSASQPPATSARSAQGPFQTVQLAMSGQNSFAAPPASPFGSMRSFQAHC